MGSHKNSGFFNSFPLFGTNNSLQFNDGRLGLGFLVRANFFYMKGIPFLSHFLNLRPLKDGTRVRHDRDLKRYSHYCIFWCIFTVLTIFQGKLDFFYVKYSKNTPKNTVM